MRGVEADLDDEITVALPCVACGGPVVVGTLVMDLEDPDGLPVAAKRAQCGTSVGARGIE